MANNSPKSKIIKCKDYEIPQHVFDTLARAFLPDIIAYYSSDIGKREFAEWERRQHLTATLRERMVQAQRASQRIA